MREFECLRFGTAMVPIPLTSKNYVEWVVSFVVRISRLIRLIALVVPRISQGMRSELTCQPAFLARMSQGSGSRLLEFVKNFGFFGFILHIRKSWRLPLCLSLQHSFESGPRMTIMSVNRAKAFSARKKHAKSEHSGSIFGFVTVPTAWSSPTLLA